MKGRVTRIVRQNAVKYSDAGTEVVVSLEEDAPWARLSVSDSAIGIAPDHLDRYEALEDYYADKDRLFLNAGPGSIWVTNGDDVEVGANTTIDRGSGPDTVIGRGAMIDNLVQIGHNVVVGAHTAMAGCVGVAGSARIGAGAALAPVGSPPFPAILREDRAPPPPRSGRDRNHPARPRVFRDDARTSRR